jgi:hypothetical protein
MTPTRKKDQHQPISLEDYSKLRMMAPDMRQRVAQGSPADYLRSEWIKTVVAVEVELKPGRAVLREPKKPWRVEISWSWDPKLKGTITPWRVDIIGETEPVGPDVFMRLDPLAYYAAVDHALKEYGLGAFTRAIPRRRPKAGRELDVDFYRRVLAAHTEIKASGHKSPTTELARRMDEPRGTVASWVSRARALHKEEK